MRRLNKGEPLPSFTQCISRNTPASWDDFSQNYQAISQDIRLHILCTEQESVCGYTELPIDDPYRCHIDHFRKRQYFSNLTFDWRNFIVATIDDDFGAKYKDGRNGIKKDEYDNIFNPVDDNVEQYFEYSKLGDILPKLSCTTTEKAKAEKTIEVFNLKHPALKRRREKIIKMLEDFGDLPPEEIKLYLAEEGFKSLINQFVTI